MVGFEVDYPDLSTVELEDGYDGRYGFRFRGGTLKYVNFNGEPQIFDTNYVSFHVPTEHTFVSG